MSEADPIARDGGTSEASRASAAASDAEGGRGGAASAGGRGRTGRAAPEVGRLGSRHPIRVALFPVDADAAKGTVLLAPDRGAPIELYGGVAEALRARGLAVLAFDWRGQGGSVRETDAADVLHVGSFGEYGADLALVVRFAEERRLPRPLFVLAEGTGGTAALMAAPSIAREVERMVLVSPVIEPRRERPAPALVRLGAFAAGLAGRTRRAAPPRFDRLRPPAADAEPPALARARAALLAERPDLAAGQPSWGWVAALERAVDALARPRAAESGIPLLIVAAGSDAVASTIGASRLVEDVPSSGMVLVRGARHALLHESAGLAGLFWAAFDAFVPTEAPRLPTARPRRERRQRSPFAPMPEGLAPVPASAAPAASAMPAAREIPREGRATTAPAASPAPARPPARPAPQPPDRPLHAPAAEPSGPAGGLSGADAPRTPEHPDHPDHPEHSSAAAPRDDHPPPPPAASAPAGPAPPVPPEGRDDAAPRRTPPPAATAPPPTPPSDPPATETAAARTPPGGERDGAPRADGERTDAEPPAEALFDEVDAMARQLADDAPAASPDGENAPKRPRRGARPKGGQRPAKGARADAPAARRRAARERRRGGKRGEGRSAPTVD